VEKDQGTQAQGAGGVDSAVVIRFVRSYFWHCLHHCILLPFFFVRRSNCTYALVSVRPLALVVLATVDPPNETFWEHSRHSKTTR